MAKYLNTYHLALKDDKMHSTEGLFIGIHRLLIFNVSLLSNAYRVLTQIPFFSRGFQ